jgi:hypothetical protein
MRLVLRGTASALLALLVLSAPGAALAAPQNLDQALLHLRAGRQTEATRELLAYRDGEPDLAIRRQVDDALAMLERPAAPATQAAIAAVLEKEIRSRPRAGARSALPWWDRNFPPFP